MTGELWGHKLYVRSTERYEPRIVQIVEFLQLEHPDGQWLITDIDGLGRLAGELTMRWNAERAFWISTDELLAALNEDGQMIELEATFEYRTQRICRILLVDGLYLEVIGAGEIFPARILGSCGALEYDPPPL